MSVFRHDGEVVKAALSPMHSPIGLPGYTSLVSCCLGLLFLGCPYYSTTKISSSSVLHAARTLVSEDVEMSVSGCTAMKHFAVVFATVPEIFLNRGGEPRTTLDPLFVPPLSDGINHSAIN